MSRNFLKWNHIVKELVKTNKICQRQFSIFTTHRNRTSVPKPPTINVPCIQPSNRRNFIGFVPDRKDGYKTQKDDSDREHIKYGLKQLKNELKLWSEEVKETLRADPLMICPPGLSIFCINLTKLQNE